VTVELDPDDALEEAEGAALATTEDATTDDTTALGAALEPATPAVTEEPATPVALVAPAAPVATTLPALDTGWPIEPPISLLPHVWIEGLRSSDQYQWARLDLLARAPPPI
jgi:hypothetical protein